MSQNPSTQLEYIRGYQEALASINIEETAVENEAARASEHQQFKDHTAAFFDDVGEQASQAFTGWGTFQFWNWGLCDDAIQKELHALLGDFDNEYSDGYSEQLYYYTLKQAPKRNNAPRRVLEVGCGNGAGLNFLSRTEGQSSFVGVDLSGRAIARANERFLRAGTLRYAQADAEALPFEEGSFDVVINVESSHNYPNLGKFLAEVTRVLKPGGYFSHVDAYTTARYEAMQRYKRTPTQLSWLSEQDISDGVRKAITMRMEPNSKVRTRLKGAMRAYRWPTSSIITTSVLNMYGRPFANSNKRSLLRMLPKRTAARYDLLSFMTSYRHSLALKVIPS